MLDCQFNGRTPSFEPHIIGSRQRRHTRRRLTPTNSHCLSLAVLQALDHDDRARSLVIRRTDHLGEAVVGRRGDSIPPLHRTISILIGSYPGGSLSDLASQALKDSVINGKVTTAEPVSGLGDQAYFGAVTGSLSFSGITLRQKQQALAVVDGIMVFLVNAGLFNGAGGIGNVSDAQALDEFRQIALRVLAQL